MAARRKTNPRLVKIHRTYTADELAECLGIHVNTVRNWMRDGLEPIDDQRPYLFHGGCVRTFLERQRADAKCPCGPDELFCLRCREPKRPAGGMVDYEPMTASGGNLLGICPDCELVMQRRTSEHQLPSLRELLEVTIRPMRCA